MKNSSMLHFFNTNNPRSAKGAVLNLRLRWTLDQRQIPFDLKNPNS